MLGCKGGLTGDGRVPEALYPSRLLCLFLFADAGGNSFPLVLNGSLPQEVTESPFVAKRNKGFLIPATCAGAAGGGLRSGAPWTGRSRSPAWGWPRHASPRGR